MKKTKIVEFHDYLYIFDKLQWI